MSTVTIEEAQSKLPELIDHLAAGEEVVIMRNAAPRRETCRAATGRPPTAVWSWSR